ncbi:MAG: sortase [Lachnospiraceae bacterium]|nr:sortase [Lachnospiraceae bacterium]
MIELGTVLILSAVLLFLYNQWEAARAQEAAQQTAMLLEAAIWEGDSDSATVKVEIVEREGTEAEEAGTEEATETVIEILEEDYIGLLEIPGFGLELPVMAEWSYAGLKTAPGRYSGYAADGDLVICGHNYERHFGKLSSLETGDTITFTAADGTVYIYEVTGVTTLRPTEVEELLSGDWDLSLFTCTVGGQARVVVRCAMAEAPDK